MTARSKAGAALALLALAALATAPAASPQTQLRPATKARAGQEASRGAPIPCALPVVRAFVAAHELGHVLGLNHERRRCSVMSPRAEFVNATLKPFPSCSPRAWAALQRDLVADADRRVARAVYGGYPTDDVAPRASDEPSLGLFGWAAIGLLAVLALAVLTQLRRR